MSGDDIKCELICESSACYNTIFNCGSGNNNTCIVDCDESEGTICPNGWSGNNVTAFNALTIEELFTNIRFDRINNYDDIMEYLMPLALDGITSITKNDVETHPNANECGIHCDRGDQCQQRHNTANNGSICCTGWASCALSYSIGDYISNGTQDSINHDIYCDGGRGCWNSTNMRAVSNVYCRGEDACQYINISIASRNSIVLAPGANSLRYGIVTMDRKLAFDHANNNNNTYTASLLCSRWASCFDTTITDVPNVYGLGTYSLGEANIICDENRDVNIYFLGFDSALVSVLIGLFNNYEIDGNASIINCNKIEYQFDGSEISIKDTGCKVYCMTQRECNQIRFENSSCLITILSVYETLQHISCPPRHGQHPQRLDLE